MRTRAVEGLVVTFFGHACFLQNSISGFLHQLNYLYVLCRSNGSQYIFNKCLSSLTSRFYGYLFLINFVRPFVMSLTSFLSSIVASVC